MKSLVSQSPSLRPRRLQVEPPLGPPLVAHLLGRQGLLNLLHLDQLLDLVNHAGKLGRDGVVDGLGALAQAQGGQDAARPLGQTDGGAVEGYAKEGHFVVFWLFMDEVSSLVFDQCRAVPDSAARFPLDR